MANADIKITLTGSDEREAIAQFVEYAFENSWVVQDVLDKIRSGAYFETVIALRQKKEKCLHSYRTHGLIFDYCVDCGEQLLQA